MIAGQLIVKSGNISRINEGNELTIVIHGQIHKFSNAFAYPGFVDSHGHLFGLGQKLFSLNLDTCSSEIECVHSALNSKERRGLWLLGRGWNQELWDERDYPAKQTLDSVFPNTPVSLTRVDGHCAWVNSIALQLAGIDRNTPNPAGGEIIRDRQGVATGILVDNAMSLVSRLIPQYSPENIIKFILAANDELLRNGITEVHDMDVRPDLINFYKELDYENKLGIRIQAFVQAQYDEWLINNIKPYSGNFFNVTGLKFYADGALGSHGAALLSPYDDKPETSGLLLIDENELVSKASKGIEAGFQIASHAIGDRANRMVINAYEKLRKIYPKAVLRIEHAQMIHPDDVRRIEDNNIFCSVQPIHCISDAKMARNRTGERNKYSYPWKTLLDAGVTMAGGSDFPIESHNPLAGLDAFINRVPFDENEPWFPEQCLSVEDAIRAYTLNAHILSGNAVERGTIEVGKQADITILNKDITKLSHSEFSNVKVLATIVNGEIKYINPELK